MALRGRCRPLHRRGGPDMRVPVRQRNPGHGADRPPRLPVRNHMEAGERPVRDIPDDRREHLRDGRGHDRGRSCRGADRHLPLALRAQEGSGGAEAGIELLAGIPSVVYGFFGLMVVVPFVRAIGPGNGLSLLSASLLLGAMILPTVITVSKNALDAVPGKLLRRRLGLGGHARTGPVFRIVVPAAFSGIMASVVLG